MHDLAYILESSEEQQLTHHIVPLECKWLFHFSYQKARIKGSPIDLSIQIVSEWFVSRIEKELTEKIEISQ